MIELHDTPAAPSQAAPLALPRSLQLQERVVGLLAPRLQELSRTLPRLHLWRRYAGGAWALGLHTRQEGAERLPYSRIDFVLRLDGAAGTVEVRCRSTLRGRDRLPHVLQVRLDEAGEAELLRRLEAALLDFAAAWWAAMPGSARVVAGTGA
jgi:hypothetical protein